MIVNTRSISAVLTVDGDVKLTLNGVFDDAERQFAIFISNSEWPTFLSLLRGEMESRYVLRDGTYVVVPSQTGIAVYDLDLRITLDRSEVTEYTAKYYEYAFPGLDVAHLIGQAYPRVPIGGDVEFFYLGPTSLGKLEEQWTPRMVLDIRDEGLRELFQTQKAKYPSLGAHFESLMQMLPRRMTKGIGRLALFKDFAENSFMFSLTLNGYHVLNGLLYYDPDEDRYSMHT